MIKIRTLYVLGAGASIGAKKYPIQNSLEEIHYKLPSAENFFYDLFKLNTKDKDRDFLNFLAVMYPGLHDFLLQSWGFKKDEQYDDEKWKHVNIEEVLTFFDVGSKMAPKNSKERLIFSKAKDHLIDFLSLILTNRCNGQHCEYLLDIFSRLEKNDSVFSYNWDTLADHTLSMLNSAQIKNYAKILRNDKFNIEDFKKKGLFLKLHGSLNWRTCRNKECTHFGKLLPPFKASGFKVLEIEQTYNCPYCKDNRPKTVIVPPISDKLIHKHYFLHKHWILAREVLLYTEKLVFIGYSFPPTDFYSEWLFRQIHFIQGRKLKQIIVVNPEYQNNKSQVNQRYNKIFRGIEIITFKTLKDFADNAK